MAASRHLSYYLAAALLVTILLPLFTAGQPLGPLCGSSGNYTANSTYQTNLRVLSTTLPKNASASPTLFATATFGTVPDIVYALALCRGDGDASGCAACVKQAFQDAQQLCAYNKDATIFYDPCLLRFSNRNFLASTTGGGGTVFIPTNKQAVTTINIYDDSGGNNGVLILMNTGNVTAPAAVFDAAVRTLINATADYAAANSSKRFGTGEEGFDRSNLKIYGLAQCTPDMASADCRTCLGNIITLMPQYFSRKQGGRILGVQCNYRYEVYPFFSGGPLLQLPAPGTVAAPAPAPVILTPPVATGGTRNRTGIVLAIAMPIVVSILAITVICFYFWRRRPARKLPRPYSTNTDGIESIESLILDLSTLQVATDNFSESNKLGEGGFGAVYKGALPDGYEIAVKRLSQDSLQGIGELKNEIVFVAKLQHKNLVRLVGVCLEKNEMLLVFEYMPNRSLDTVLFDPEKSKDLGWEQRSKIINGIARGLQYLHEDSHQKIVHRDLKASNVLLDSDMNPKISDFGLARLFDGDQSQIVTSRVIGTYGYMAPEYAMHGQYSIKSDVFSFGILILEIVLGRRNSGYFDPEQSVDLLSLIWEHWTMGTIVEIMDLSLGDHCPREQMLKFVNIGLLCVQENPADRPTMSTVNVMLGSNNVFIQPPSKPAFVIQKTGANSDVHSELYRRASHSTGKSTIISQNEISIRELEPR